MNFRDEDVVIEPYHQTTKFDGSYYKVGDQILFYERQYWRRSMGRGHASPPSVLLWLALDPSPCTQWFAGSGTHAEIEALAKKHGGYAEEEFYPDPEDPVPRFFLAFDDTDKALAFCHTEDFDKLCLTMEKV